MTKHTITYPSKGRPTYMTLSYAELDAISRFFDAAYNEGKHFDRAQLRVAERIDQHFLYNPEQSIYTEKLAELDT